MHFEVLVEDRSGGTIVDALLGRMLPAGKHTYDIRPHRGKGEFLQDPMVRPDRMTAGLLDLLPAKLRAYSAVLDPAGNALIVLMDSDEEDPSVLVERIEALCRRFAPVHPRVVALSIEEMESWLLGDPEAVKLAYPDADSEVLAAYRQDSICGTWEVLARALMGEDALPLIQEGYPEAGRKKHEWAESISPHLDPARNRSPSFHRFSNDLSRILETHP